MNRFPENRPAMIKVHRTTKLKRRRRKTLARDGGGAGAGVLVSLATSDFSARRSQNFPRTKNKKERVKIDAVENATKRIRSSARSAPANLLLLDLTAPRGFAKTGGN